MTYSGEGGLGAVSIGIPEAWLWLAGLVVLLLLVAAGWKRLKLLC